MAKQKYMISKYDGTCSTCGRAVDAGEPILWVGRGTIECNDCAPQPMAQASAPASSDAWANALAWDDNTPQAGASIASNVTPLPVAEVREQSLDTRTAADFEREPPVERTSDVTRILDDMLCTLVNALDNATASERQHVHAQALTMAEQSASASRARVWRAMADAAIA